MCGNVICQWQTIADVHETRVHFFKRNPSGHSRLNGIFILYNINYYLVVTYAMYTQFINYKTRPERGAQCNSNSRRTSAATAVIESISSKISSKKNIKRQENYIIPHVG